MQVERQAVTALKWHTAGRLVSQTFSWAVTLIVLRLLAPEDYGLMAVATVIISIIAGTAEFGLGSSLIQAETLDRSELSRIAGALALLNLMCGAALALAAPLLAKIFHEPGLDAVIKVASIVFIFHAIAVAPQSLLQREMNFRSHAIIELSSVVTASVTTLVLAWNGAGVWALVIGNLAGEGTRALLLCLLGTFVMPSPRIRGIGKHIRFGGQVTAARFIWQLTFQLDTLIAARFLNSQAVGLYSVAMHFATLPVSKTMSIINQVAFPAVARLQDDIPRVRVRMLEALRLLALVAIPTLWGLSATAHEFVHVILGEAWVEAVLPLAIVSLIAPGRMLLAIFGTAASAIGRADLELRNTIVGACILPAAFLIGVQGHLNGLATSWLLAFPLVITIALPANCAPIGIKMRDIWQAVRGPMIAGAAMYAAVIATRAITPDLDDVVHLPILVCAGGIAYVGVLHLVDPSSWTAVRRLTSALRA